MKRVIVGSVLALAVAGVVSMTGCAATHGHAKGKGLESEVKITLADCPHAVSRTLKAEVRDGQIKEVSRESEDGKAVYSADATIEGKDYEIKVLADGTLLSKELDVDNEKSEGDKDKEAKEEKKSGKPGSTTMDAKEKEGGKGAKTAETGKASDSGGGKGDDDDDDDD